MNIALVHDHLNQIGGAEKVLHAFTKMFPNAPIFTILYDQAIAREFFGKTKIIGSFLQKHKTAHRHFKWFLPLMPTAVESLNLKGYDVVISDSSAFSKGVITDVGAIHICYCHTPTRYLWSDSWEYIVELHNKNFIVKKFLPPLLTYLRLWDFQAAQRVDEFIANSNFVRKRIQRFYKRDATVIYPPVETEKYTLVNEKEDYFVIVSRLRPYKRVDLAIEAFNEMRLPLKIIGGGWEMRYLKKKANKNIEFLGEIMDAKQKNEIIGHASALIHPQEEDFGISAVEAMSCGTPVIAYKQGGALETVEEGITGMFFEDQSWESLANTVVHFNAREFDYAKIKERAERFGVERFKREINEFVLNVLKQTRA
ncbi:MAG: glycosyltransferase [Candidatus Jacksonbacteria bacterium]|nr:glycosyltransferase [Candidatus Jacksonbacteria bacterium]